MPSPAFVVELAVQGAPEQVWARLWDLDRHTAAVPLTTTTGGPVGPRSTFTARTALGPLALDDVMEVRDWEPPHRAVVVKTGRVLGGSIEVVLEPGPPAESATGTTSASATTLLRWRQSYSVTHLPDRLAALARPAAATAYRISLRRITRPSPPGRST